MPKVYTRANPADDVMNVVQEMISNYHPDLSECDAQIAVLFVQNLDRDGMPAGDAVTCNGHPCAAKIRLATKDRQLHRFDAIIEVDLVWWNSLSTNSANALIDHQLTHLEIVRIHGEIQQHDDLRPKIRLRKDDWALTGFREVVERHGNAALEYQGILAVATARDVYGNMLFDFAKDLDPKYAKKAAEHKLAESKPQPAEADDDYQDDGDPVGSIVDSIVDQVAENPELLNIGGRDMSTTISSSRSGKSVSVRGGEVVAQSA